MNKPFFLRIKILASLLLLLFFLACTSGNHGNPDLVLLYTTDSHGYLEEDEKTIGIDTIAAIRKQTPNALLLDAGDFLHGSSLARVTKGRDVIALMKKAGYFAAAVGNHEFDYGRKILLERVEEAQRPPDSMQILSANILDENGKTLLKPWAEAAVSDVRVCVFGLTTEETPKQTRPSHVEGLTFSDPVSVAKSLAKELKSGGCEVIIALAHLGSDSFMPVTSVDLGLKVPDIDLVIDGHSHVILEKRLPDGRLVVSSGEHGKALGVLSLFLDRKTRKIRHAQNLFLKPEDTWGIAPDAETGMLLEKISREEESFFSEKIGSLEKDFQAEKVITRTGQTALGNLCADALRKAGNADLALINGGAIRSGLKKGAITRENLFDVLPFDGKLVLLEISGKEVKALLEHGFSRLPKASGAFPQVSGVRIELDTNREPGCRIRSMTLENGQALDTDKIYRVVVNDFIADGGDGYFLPQESARTQLSITAVEALAEHLREKENFSHEHPARIRFLSE